ncbi:hypothetical protein [Halorussus halobius]|uniref:hypothetical protein n=1 Tax=Halorussus halobius TaxID=1710537 RepID=UPI0010922B78|nr:hypothetical protein [Halorussus halobius]
MAATTPSETAVDDVEAPMPPAHYAERADAGDVTWIEDAIEDWLGITPTEKQREICRAVAEHEQVLVVSANGLGKSYILAAITIVWLFCRYPAVSFATSGTERKMKRTYCKPVDNLHSNARVPLPGEYKSRPERIEVEGDPEHFFEAASPKDAGELEGVHTAYTLAIIEEADKPDVDEDVIDAMRSLTTDSQDRMIAIANPPEDETNSIYPYMDDHPEWEVLEFSSFEAHNVQVETGAIEGEKVDGIATVSKLRKDWVEYNGSEWPGVDQARTWSDPESSEFRADLAKRWYRRRAGIMPPDGATVHRPFGVAEVNAAWERGEVLDDDSTFELPAPDGFGIDVARSSDQTVLATVHDDVIIIHYDERGTDHMDQGADLEQILSGMASHPVAVDFIGHGSSIHDQLNEVLPDVGKFEANSEASQGTTYYDKWAEGMDLLGTWLENGGCILERNLRQEMLAGARELEFEEKFYASRGEDGAEVYKLSSKDDIKDRLDHSPDYLDAAMQAVWAASDDTEFDDDDDEVTVHYKSGSMPSQNSIR